MINEKIGMNNTMYNPNTGSSVVDWPNYYLESVKNKVVDTSAGASNGFDSLIKRSDGAHKTGSFEME